MPIFMSLLSRQNITRAEAVKHVIMNPGGAMYYLIIQKQVLTLPVHIPFRDAMHVILKKIQKELSGRNS